ncbi:TPA: addiction module toxin, HicA family [Enterococcus hirae]
MPMTQNEMVKLLVSHGGVKVKFPGVTDRLSFPKNYQKGRKTVY